MTGSGQRSVSAPVILLPVTGEHQEAFSLHGLPCTADAMFAKLIFTSLVLQLAEAIRPAEKSRSDNACGDLGTAGCATCDSNSGNKICLTCTDPAKFIAVNKKSCKAACDANGGEIEAPVVGSTKACKCDEDNGYTLQGDACVIPNTNKSSGLSTGAIAGIAVAAVIVVGGLVGFLCWWFLCRGKA
eukprot:XP_001706456.1 VSP [Giardia lamblia ATCC 50803]